MDDLLKQFSGLLLTSNRCSLSINSLSRLCSWPRLWPNQNFVAAPSTASPLIVIIINCNCQCALHADGLKRSNAELSVQLIDERKHLVARWTVISLRARRSPRCRLRVREFTSSISTRRPIGCQLHSADNLSARLAGALRCVALPPPTFSGCRHPSATIFAVCPPAR